MTRRQTEKAIACIAAITAGNAFGGSFYGFRGAPDVPLEWLHGSPFRDYRIPSAILGIGVGGSSAASAITAWRGSEHSGSAAMLAGAVLTGWIAAQVAIIGPRSLLQPLMGGAGLALIGLGVGHRLVSADAPRASSATGAIIGRQSRWSRCEGGR